jgi:hypothetical protein
MRDIRLGDDIDDFCVRCKRVMNHNVVSVLDGQAAKVRCRTCHSDHDFRHEQAPPPKIDARKAALFNEVLKKVAPSDAPADGMVDVADTELGIMIPELEIDSESETETELEGAAEVEAVEVAEVVEVVEVPPPAPKKVRGRPKK